MATLDTSYVRQELFAIRDSSNAIKHLLHEALERLESNPGSFPELKDVPRRIRVAYPNVAMRKVVLESGKHSFRLVLAHWERTHDHVDVLYAFPRLRGYPIDWDEVEKWLKSHDE